MSKPDDNGCECTSCSLARAIVGYEAEVKALLKQVAAFERGLDAPRRSDAEKKLALLSPAERLVFDAMLSGGDAQCIAQALGISRATVRNQIIAVFRKMEMSSHLEILAAFVVPPA